MNAATVRKQYALSDFIAHDLQKSSARDHLRRIAVSDDYVLRRWERIAEGVRA